MGTIGAPEDRAEHLVEHDERGIAENGLHLACEHDQGRQTTRRVETRNVAGDEDGDFPRDCSVARAVNAFLAVSADTELANGLKPFDERDEISLARRFRPFPQPSKRRAVFAIGDGEQRFQSCNHVWRQTFGEAPVGTLAGEGARRQGDLFQGDGGGKQNMPLAQIFDHRGYDRVAAIRTYGLVEGDMSHRAFVIAIKGADCEIGLKFAQMRAASLLPLRVVFERLGVVSQLRRDESQHIRWRHFIDSDDAAWKFQEGEMDREPEPVGGATTFANQCQVFGRECVVAHDRRRLSRRIE